MEETGEGADGSTDGHIKILKRQRFDGTMCGVRDQIVSWLKLHFAQAMKSYYQREGMGSQ